MGGFTVAVIFGSLSIWSGSGSGYGYGEDVQAYLQAIINGAIGEYAETLRCVGSEIAWWRSGKNGEPSNGGKGTVAKIGLIEEIDGPLHICISKALHATINSQKWKGERLWIVALYPPLQRKNDKIASFKEGVFG